MQINKRSGAGRPRADQEVSPTLVVMSRLVVVFWYLLSVVLLHAALPLAYEPNRGQADSRFLYLARSSDHAVYLSSTEAVLASSGARPIEIRFENGLADTTLEPNGALPGVSNYFIGRDSKNWRTGIPQFSSVRYHHLYPGIDLIFHGDEFDFDIAPHADPRAIHLRFDSGHAEITPEGDIALGPMRLQCPIIYQGGRIIPGRFQVDRDGLLTFALSSYDHSRKLTIDPVITWSQRRRRGHPDRCGCGWERGRAGDHAIDGFSLYRWSVSACRIGVRLQA